LADSVRVYSPGERLADAIVHVLGISLSLVAVALLLVHAAPRVDASTTTALAIYGAALIALFVASAAYHMTPLLHWKPVLKRFDQAAIFLKIAGTYTPLVVLLGSIFAYGLLVAIWAAALFGAIAKLAFRTRFQKISVALYLPLGWTSLLLIWPIWTTLPPAATILIVAGGVLYTVGVLFHVWEKLKFQNAIWHGFVLAASACHFAAVVHASFATIV
jgi:hemolysin III